MYVSTGHRLHWTQYLEQLFEIVYVYSFETKWVLFATTIGHGILGNRKIEHLTENRRILNLSTRDLEKRFIDLRPNPL